MTYLDFLKTKIEIAPVSGFKVSADDLSPVLKPHQRDAVGYLQAEEDKIDTPTLFDFFDVN